MNSGRVFRSVPAHIMSQTVRVYASVSPDMAAEFNRFMEVGAACLVAGGHGFIPLNVYWYNFFVTSENEAFFNGKVERMRNFNFQKMKNLSVALI